MKLLRYLLLICLMGFMAANGAVAAVTVDGTASRQVEGAYDLPRLQADMEKGSVQLVDVRSPEEYKAGHVDGAINMPVSTMNENLDKLSTDKPVVFMCAAGRRAANAYNLAKQARPERAGKLHFVDAAVKYDGKGNASLKPN